MNDQRAAGAAAGHQQLAAGLVKHQGGGHGRAGPLAALHTVGDGFALRISGYKAEIGELVIEQKTMHHLARTKSVFDGGGHGQRMTAAVHDADVTGAVFGLLGHGCVAADQRARAHAWHAGGADQAGTRGQVIGGQQAQPAAARGRYKVRVGHILSAVGKGQARGFGIAV